MFRIREAIVVEGRYDKNTLSQVVDTLILETNGFGLFKDPERMALLRTAARKRGLIVLTDSDGAGFVIRNRIKSSIPQELSNTPTSPMSTEKRSASANRARRENWVWKGCRPRSLRTSCAVRELLFWGRTGQRPPLPTPQKQISLPPV